MPIVLRTKLILCFIAVAGPPLVLAVVSCYELVQRLILDLQTERCQDTVRIVQESLDQSALELTRLLRSIRDDEPIADLIAARRAGDGTRVEQALDELRAGMPRLRLWEQGILHLRYIDETGRARFHLEAGPEGVRFHPPGARDPAVEIYHRMVRGLSGPGPFIAGRATIEGLGMPEGPDRQAIHCALPVSSGGESSLGFLVVQLSPRVLLQPVRPLFRGLKATLLLVDHQGRVLDAIGESSPLQPGDGTEAWRRDPVGGWSVVGDTAFLPRLFPLPEMWRGMEWGLIFGFSRQPLLDRLGELRTITLAALGTALVLVLLTGLAVSDRLRAPVVAIRDRMRALSEGRPVEPVPATSRDEIADLARGFNAMARSLEEKETALRLSRDELEERVEARTRAWKVAEDRLRQSERLSGLGLLAGGVAHEINNPMATILTTVKFLLYRLRSGEALDGLRPSLEKLERQGERVTRIVQDLLVLGRRSPQAMRPIATVSLVQETLSSLEEAIRSRQAIIETDLTEVPSMKGDPTKLHLVLRNLVANALDASPPGGRVRIAARVVDPRPPDPARLEIRVEDEGAGIEPDDLARVFDPFFTRKPAGKGSGLGLSLAHAIVADHGGELTAASDPGRRTVFTVLLPLKPSTPEERP